MYIYVCVSSGISQVTLHIITGKMDRGAISLLCLLFLAASLQGAFAAVSSNKHIVEHVEANATAWDCMENKQTNNETHVVLFTELECIHFYFHLREEHLQFLCGRKVPGCI